MTKRVLVLGGTSYVAQFVCSRFLHGTADGPVQELSCTVRASELPLPEGFVLATEATASLRSVRVFTGVSLLDLDSVTSAIEAFKPNVIINCVAMSSPAACERDPVLAKALNEPTALISYLRSRPGTALQYFHFSTDFVYDGENTPSRGYREEQAEISNVQGVYSSTKLGFDQYLLAQPVSSSLQVVVLRIANVVGGPAPLFPNQAPKFAQWLYHELALSPAKHATAVRLWSDEVRSFLNVHDLVEVIWQLLQAQSSQATAQIFNVGGVDALSRVDFAKRLLQELHNHQTDATPINHRPIQAALRAEADMGMRPTLDVRLDCSKLLRVLPTLRLSTTQEIIQQLGREFTHK